MRTRMGLRSRICTNFANAQTSTFVHRSLPASQIRRTIMFAIEYWQPFIGQQSPNIVCGPLLGVLIEFANALNSNLTFIAHEGEEILPFNDVQNGSTQIVLTPYPAMSLNQPLVRRLFRFTTFPLGDMPLISILSGKQVLPLFANFDSLSLFNYIFFYLYFPILFVLNVMAYFFRKHLQPNLRCPITRSRNQMILRKIFFKNFATNTLRIMLKQPIKFKYPFRVDHLLLANIFWLTGFLNVLISTKLLTFFTFTQNTDKIDTIEQLRTNREMPVYLFEGELAADVFREDSAFRGRIFIENPPNEESNQFELEMSERINARKVAMITDSYFLNHLYNNNAFRFPNLYRSTCSQLVMPYFLPLSYKNSVEFNRILDQTILKVLESGLYNFWIQETVLMNNPSLYHGFAAASVDSENQVDPRDVTFEYSALSLADISLLFYVCGTLYALAAFAFSLELFAHALKQIIDSKCLI